jgi:hypothetical protein
MWALWGRRDEEIVMEPNRAKPPVTAKSHLAEAFRWSTETRPNWVEFFAAAIGMAVPILLGAAMGALVPAAATSVIAISVAGHSWMSDTAVALLAGAAGLLAAMGRPVAPMAIRFILLLVITVTVADNVTDRDGLLFLIAAGALWTSAVSLLLGALARARRGRHDIAAETAPPSMTLNQRLTRWRRSLISLAGNMRSD